jgi:HAD superfamily hydrolase (TIGR01509 family)
MKDSLILFDCDGVLVDSEPVANAVLAEHLTQHGLPTSPQQALERYKGRSLKSVLAMAEDALGRSLPAHFLADMQAETFRAFEKHLRAVSGAEDLVQWVQAQGYRTCIASSGDYEKLDKTLGITGLKKYFEGRIFSAVDVENGKPAPDLFLHASEAMGTPPQRCFVIEDSGAGIAASIAAGMHVFAYGPFEKAHNVTPVKRLRDIKELL